jgi:predicted alpha/beta hydrolase family esterase
MNNNFKIVFVHGYTASHLADWYPAISPLLDQYGWDYVIPDLPGDEHPHAPEWLNTLQEVISKSDKPLVLVGHSLGTRAILLYLEKYKPKVKSIFLISSFANWIENGNRRDGDSYPDFFSHKINLDDIKQLAEKMYILHSKDDSSIPYQQGKEMAADLGAELLTFNGRDHFCEPKNAALIAEILQQKLTNI